MRRVDLHMTVDEQLKNLMDDMKPKFMADLTEALRLLNDEDVKAESYTSEYMRGYISGLREAASKDALDATCWTGDWRQQALLKSAERHNEFANKVEADWFGPNKSPQNPHSTVDKQ